MQFVVFCEDILIVLPFIGKTPEQNPSTWRRSTTRPNIISIWHSRRTLSAIAFTRSVRMAGKTDGRLTAT